MTKRRLAAFVLAVLSTTAGLAEAQATQTTSAVAWEHL